MCYETTGLERFTFASQAAAQGEREGFYNLVSDRVKLLCALAKKSDCSDLDKFYYSRGRIQSAFLGSVKEILLLVFECEKLFSTRLSMLESPF